MINHQLYQQAAERNRLEQELDVARDIQTSLIPAGNPAIPGCTVDSYWHAARQVSEHDRLDAVAVGPRVAAEVYGLEVLVSFIQAYVFTILTCVYLKDALHPHH